MAYINDVRLLYLSSGENAVKEYKNEVLLRIPSYNRLSSFNLQLKLSS